MKPSPKPAVIPDDTSTFLSAQHGGVLLAVKLQPRASRNEICAPLGDELKIKVTAPPVDAAVAVGGTLMHLVKASNLWLYLVANFAAGGLAALVFKFVNPEDK